MLRRLETNNDLRPFPNDERIAMWAAKYYLMPLSQRQQLDEPAEDSAPRAERDS
jgi:hypothetical protein